MAGGYGTFKLSNSLLLKLAGALFTGAFFYLSMRLIRLTIPLTITWV